MKALIILMIVSVACSVSYSQTTNRIDYTQFAAKETDMMVQRLQLNAAQKNKIAAINKSYFNKIDLVRNSPDSFGLRKQKVELFDQEKINAYSQVLTKEQLLKYEADLAEIKRKFQEKAQEQMTKQQQNYKKRDSVAVRH